MNAISRKINLSNLNLLILFSLITLFISCKKEKIVAQTTSISYNRTIIIDSNPVNVYDPYFMNGEYLLKGQMHCHTTNSDGKLSPQQVAHYYDSLGYDFYTITDHNYITTDPKNTDLIWIGDSYEHTMWSKFHICIYQTSKLFPPDNDFNTTYNKVKEFNSESTLSLAHPDWNGLYQSDSSISAIKNIDFIELSNGNGNTSTFKSRVFDSLLTANKQVRALAGDDFHHYSQYTNSWIEVLAFEKNKESIWEAIKYGSFYATKGAKMDVILLGNGIIQVTTPIVSTITFIGKGGNFLKSESNVLTSEYQIIGNEQYVRCEVIDANEKLCWSQAILIEN